jgi:hypothetical protein
MHGQNHIKWNPLFSRSVGYCILGDFEESAQEQTVHFNIQPTGFSEFQLIKTKSSNKSTLASSYFLTVLSHKSTPSTLATHPQEVEYLKLQVQVHCLQFQTKAQLC